MGTTPRRRASRARTRHADRHPAPGSAHTFHTTGPAPAAASRRSTRRVTRGRSSSRIPGPWPRADSAPATSAGQPSPPRRLAAYPTAWMTVDDPNRRESLTAQKRRGPHSSWQPGSTADVTRLEPFRRTDMAEVEIRAEIRMPQRRQRGAQVRQLTARTRIDRADAHHGSSTGRKIDVRAVSASGKPQGDERQWIGHTGSRCKTRRGGISRDRCTSGSRAQVAQAQSLWGAARLRGARIQAPPSGRTSQKVRIECCGCVEISHRW